MSKSNLASVSALEEAQNQTPLLIISDKFVSHERIPAPVPLGCVMSPKLAGSELFVKLSL